jgi:hypothetical protein
MPSLFSKAARLYHSEGMIPLARRTLQFIYNRFIRSLLPRTIVSYNGVSVYESRLGDSIISWQTINTPEYKDAIIQSMGQHVELGDTVAIVGSGWGVSSVVAAEQTGEFGKVITHEASESAVGDVVPSP